MKTAVHFRFPLAFDGEILARSATFLPVEPARLHTGRKIYPPEMPHLAGFPPVLIFNRKNSPVAQPLLKEDLR